MRHMYHTPGITDLDKLRASAADIRKGDSRSEPQEVTIHHHKHGEPCGDRNHETGE